MTINCKGRILQLDTPKVMGIININEDSFFADSRKMAEKDILLQAEKMLMEGADFLDVGGQSTRPGSQRIGEEEELQRAIPAVELLNKHYPEAVISIDSYYAKVAKVAVESGASIINDISAGNMDAEMYPTVAALQVPYVLMHMQGTPQNMQTNPKYRDVTREVNFFFSEKVASLRAWGVNDIILDPGFGFGKSLDHNYNLLRDLEQLGFGDFPVLAGVSRKSMVTRLLDVSAKDALNGTTALHILCLQNGVKILRVHDVKAAVETIKIWKAYAKI